MNGVHDLGGMHGMGPIERETNEPVFHARWEGRVYAMNRALGLWRKWNLDTSRWVKELFAPADYFRMSYYERWYSGLIKLLVDSKMVTAAEIEGGKPAKGSPKLVPPLRADQVAPLFTQARFEGKNRAGEPPRFQVGQRVRARNMNPAGHTRLPRYARGRIGTIERDQGVFTLPDANATFLGENPQHVYSVRFSARELWGEDAKPQDAVYIDMWDSYLEHA
jgi:nitrile hydratase